MKLLLDENLSHRLVDRLAELYPESTLWRSSGYSPSPDREVWEFAKTRNFVIVSADSDFYELATTIGPPPKVVWLRRWTHPTRDAEEVLRREAIRITEFVSDPELGVLGWTATDDPRTARSPGCYPISTCFEMSRLST